MSGSKTPTIIAITALVIALLAATPLGQAAGRFVLPKNSVGAAQLKKSAVGTKKIAKNAITSLKVKDGSLLAADFKAGQLPQGRKGDKGDPGLRGPKGDPGVAHAIVRQSAIVSVAANSAAIEDAYCKPGELATGGGPVGLDPGVFIQSSYAGGDTNAPSSWHLIVRNTNAAPKSFSVTVVCVVA